MLVKELFMNLLFSTLNFIILSLASIVSAKNPEEIFFFSFKIFTLSMLFNSFSMMFIL